MPNKYTECTSLLLEIETIRTLMMLSAKNKGLSHPQTVRYSQALDDLLNKYDESLKN
ncbi:sporulation protein Spo0E [Alteribacter lacisalsi]|uniref:Sporulation protein Spo0E n=1 Tax=Alteribacter lacisalsi TaxID=2045244 RepID=A0A2W0H5V3_9BACI|nr:aspartyl-phosphate phosphatase Spo0E family protein [Alteribacter lacisalsi]PYZ96401.1 sporulation protein Spo0E [Alteribacter lacisalsi]